MIKKLRRRIVYSTMSSLLVIMLTLLMVVNSVTEFTNNSTADGRIAQLYYIAQYIRDNPGNRIDYPDNDTGYNLQVFDESENSWQRYIIVWYREDGSMEMLFLGSNFVTEEEALKYVERAENKNGDKGWIEYYRYGKFVEDDGEGYLILDYKATEKSRIDSMLQSSVITAAVSCVAMFIIALIFSKRATVPVERAMENQKRFITDASHELKTPITIISANNEIIELNHGVDTLTQSNRTQLERMSSLIQKMIDMSKFDENTEDVDHEAFSLTEAVYDTVMSFMPIIETSNKELSLKLDDVAIESDETKVRQMIAILMDNAVKYSSADSMIKVKLTQGKHSLLTIENSCSNVDDIDMNKIFDRFYREDKVRTGGAGYGLGLSIAKSICETCNFEIKVKRTGISRIMFTVKF